MEGTADTAVAQITGKEGATEIDAEDFNYMDPVDKQSHTFHCRGRSHHEEGDEGMALY